jgi:hypothetical protein
MWPSMGKPNQSHFFQMSMFMCFINLLSIQMYHVQNILCKGHHSISNILWVITFWNVGLGKKRFWYIFEVWIKELYWNTNFNDIRCNFKALLNIFLHFVMLPCSDLDKMILNWKSESMAAVDSDPINFAGMRGMHWIKSWNLNKKPENWQCCNALPPNWIKSPEIRKFPAHSHAWFWVWERLPALVLNNAHFNLWHKPHYKYHKIFPES